MRLRRKTILAVAVILTIMTLLIVAIASTLVLDSARAQERREVQGDLVRAMSAIDNLKDDMGRAVRDWAGWNDTYRFVEDRDQTYIDSNLAISTFAGLNLNVMIFINSSQQVVIAQGFDPGFGQLVPVSQDIIDAVLENEKDMSFNDVESNYSGLLLVDGGVLVVAIHAVTNSQFTAPVRGNLVMGQFLTPELTTAISKEIMVQTELVPLDEWNGYPFSTSNLPGTAGPGTQLISPINDTDIEAYTPLKSLNGTAVAVLRIVASRDAYAQASSSITLLTSTLVLVSLAFVVVTLVVTDRFTMRRVERLSDQVGEIGLNGDISKRVMMDGSDELTVLANEVNKALDAIETISTELIGSESRYRAIVNDQMEMIFRILEDGTITFANDAMLKELYRQPQEVLGKNLSHVVVPSLYAGIMDHCGEARETKKVVVRDYHYHHRFEKRDKWYSWSVRGIYGQNGQLNEYQGVGRDLTEKKEAEVALNLANKKLNLLASITRHDVMNQLTVAHGFVSITRLQTTDKRLVEHLTKAEAALQSIQGHLEFTKDYQRMGLVQPVWIRLKEAVEKASAVARSDGIEVKIDVGDYEIHTDPLMEKVFYNLIDNSVRHGGVVKKIEVTCRQVELGLLILFEDDGKGIPKHEKELIFDAGYGTNTGYGLFLAREILGASGMTIFETGEPGKGARFEILVPKGRFRKSAPVE